MSIWLLKSQPYRYYRYFVSPLHVQRLQCLFFSICNQNQNVMQHCFIRHHSDLTMLEDSGIEPRTVTMFAWAVRALRFLLRDTGAEGSSQDQSVKD